MRISDWSSDVCSSDLVEAGIGPRLHAIPRDAELVPQAAQHELAAEHADRAGNGAGLGDDRLRGGGDEIAAGPRDVAHRYDDRLADVAGALHLGPDGVGRDIGADRKSVV